MIMGTHKKHVQSLMAVALPVRASPGQVGKIEPTAAICIYCARQG